MAGAAIRRRQLTGRNIMNTTKGYYSLIQFCPNASRLESVNVGVLLFCPDIKFIEARTSRSVIRAEKLVGRAGLDKLSLNAAKIAFERRLHTDRDAFKNLDDLQRFVDSRGNVLKLTLPRPVKVLNPDQDLDNLFRELVGGAARKQPNEPSLTDSALDSFFKQLQRQGRAKLDWDVTIPLLDRSLHVPYAYQNGVWNLVKPHQFPAQERKALSSAGRLAFEGDLLFKHPTDDNGQKKLIIICSYEQDAASVSLQERVENVLRVYNVKTIPSKQLETFLAEVARQAHA